MTATEIKTPGMIPVETSVAAAIQAGREIEAGDQIARDLAHLTEERGRVGAFMLVPKDRQLVDLKPYLPRGRAQAMDFFEVESFIDWFLRFRSSNSRIWYHGGGKFSAIIDYHPADYLPAHVLNAEPDAQGVVKLVAPWEPCAERATLQLQQTPEAAAWLGIHGKATAQVEFAMFVEDWLQTAVQPEAAELLELVSSLQARKDVDWKSGIRLQNGDTQLVYQENTTASAGREAKMEIPEKITVRFALYRGQAEQEWTARLRYAIDRGNPLRFTAKFIALERAKIDAEEAIRCRIEQATGVSCWHTTGVPSC